MLHIGSFLLSLSSDSSLLGLNDVVPQGRLGIDD